MSFTRPLGSAPKVVPGLVSPLYYPEGQTRMIDYSELERRNLPLAPIVEHGSYATGQPSLLRYGRDPYRGLLGQAAELATRAPVQETLTPGLIPAPVPTPSAASFGPRPNAAAAFIGTAYTLVRPLAGAAMAYHGYRRHHGSIGWALLWALMGGAFPLLSGGIALAQGFGEPMKERRG